MKICLTGDVFLGGDLTNFNQRIVYSKPFNTADIRIVNLEQAISDNDYVEAKSTLYTKSFATKILVKLNIDAVCLANNHIHDKGLDGIKETTLHLNQHNIKYFGAGKNLLHAKQYYLINDEVVVLGYCDFSKPTLNNIAVASQSEAGVNPLRYENILDDLSSLNSNQKAILYFHWGREHMWLPAYENIQLAKKILEHDKVLTIIGMHPHRVQGYVKHNNKVAYMCLGNFIFPNFFISPPTQILNEVDSKSKYLITRKYHHVSKLTYKKWNLVNRVSMIVEVDSNENSVKHNFVYQKDHEPTIHDILGVKLKLLNIFVLFLSFVYSLPKSVYVPLEKINTTCFGLYWKLSILCFWLRQDGILVFIKKALRKLKLI